MILLDFCVSLRFTASQAQIDNIAQVFTEASNVLADATDGQFAFGNIDIVNNSGASLQAEVWILKCPGRAYATCGLYGTPGEHIVLYEPSNFLGIPAPEGDAYTIAHEFGHHVWGLKDEYTGPGGPADCEVAPGSTLASYCLMDNFFLRGGNSGGGSTYTLNELCVASNHDPDMDTEQENIWLASCWELIASHPDTPGTAPLGLPIDAPPTVAPPVFRLPATDRRFVLCIDRSGSMAQGNPSRMEFAKQAAKIFVDLTMLGDSLAVTSFANAARTDFQLTQIVQGGGHRLAAKNAINSLQPNGGTNIGGALSQSRDELLSQPVPSCAQTILLLTDGQHNSGPDPLTIVPSLIDNDIAVITIGIGVSINASLLQQIACMTGGRFFQVATAADLPTLLSALSAESSGGGVLARQPSSIATDETFVTTIPVDAVTTEVTFALNWDDPADDLDLSLLSPGGILITPADAPGNPDIRFVNDNGTEILVVRGAAFESGTWTVQIFGASVVSAGAFELLVLSEADNLSFTVGTAKPEYVFPEPVIVMATPRFNGNNVLGAEVAGTYTQADGTMGPLTPRDNGNQANGDDVMGDGIYSARLPTFGGNGAYEFNLEVRSLQGMTFGGEDLYATVGAPVFSEPVPPFSRVGAATVVISGVPFIQALPCFHVNDLLIDDAAGATVLRASIDGGDLFDPTVEDLCITLIDEVDGDSASYLIPAGSYEVLGDLQDRRYGFHSPPGVMPVMHSRIALNECLFFLQIQGGLPANLSGPTVLVRVSSTTSGVGEESVRTLRTQGGELRYNPPNSPSCCR
jgi:hypothetical protein